MLSGSVWLAPSWQNGLDPAGMRWLRTKLRNSSRSGWTLTSTSAEGGQRGTMPADVGHLPVGQARRLFEQLPHRDIDAPRVAQPELR
jgi:hypothetical protein